MVQSHRNQDGAGTSAILDQLQGISSPKSVTSRGRDVIGGIQPMFVYQLMFPDYYELVEDWELEKKPILMYLKRLRIIINNHLNIQRHR
jgi:hypothetical protein